MNTHSVDILGLAETLETPIAIIDQRAYFKMKKNRGELAKLALTAASPVNMAELDKALVKPYRLAVIHSSLLESLCKQARTTEQQKLNDIFKAAKDDKSIIYLTSGKSEPPWVKKVNAKFANKVKFVPWADLEQPVTLCGRPLDKDAPDTGKLLLAKQQLLEILLNK